MERFKSRMESSNQDSQILGLLDDYVLVCHERVQELGNADYKQEISNPSFVVSTNLYR